jgi:hypothetical protein
MRKSFRNNIHQNHFEEKGYILVDGFLNSEEVNRFRNWYQTNYQDSFGGFHASMHSLDFDYRRKVHQKITQVFFPKADKLLEDYRSVVGNFTVKETGPESFFDFHLDWSMLDEGKARSVTIWVPLDDTNTVNGNLWILEGSTHLGDTWRCSPGLQLYADSDIDFATKKYRKKVLPMKAGDAIIYDHKLFHGSPPNLSGKPRLAINLALLPKEVPSLHFFNDNGEIKVFEVDDYFYCTCLTHSEMDMSTQMLAKKSHINKSKILQGEVNQLIEINYVKD